MKNDIKLFEEKQVRVQWDEKSEKWYLSVIDIISTLTDSTIPKRYWSDLKKKLTQEGSQLYEKIVQLKFEAADGKKYATDCLETQDVFRLIQSIPSPKAEPFKRWLAQVAAERLDEMQDPELSIDRALEQYFIQSFKRFEKGKPARQHDQYRVDIKHACRGIDQRYFAGNQPQRL